MKGLFAPMTPAEVERLERERVAKKKPALALVTTRDPRPDPEMFRWVSIAELMERGR